MSTLDKLAGRVPVDKIEARAADMPAVNWRRVGLAALTVLPTLLGLAAGIVWRAIVLGVSAVVVGFDAGRGDVRLRAAKSKSG